MLSLRADMTYLHTFATTSLLAASAFALAACASDPPGGQEGTGTTSPTTSPTDSSEPATTTPTTEDSTPTTGETTGAASTSELTSTDPTTTTAPGTTTDTTSDTTTSDTTTSATTSETTGEPAAWTPPNCDLVTGTGAVTFSKDQGATLTPMDQQIVPVTYTWGLVALGKPGAMLAGSKDEILASADAGCSWHSIGPTPSGNAPAMTLRAAGDTRAYGFGDNDSTMVRVDDEVLVELTSPAGQDGIVGLGVDPGDPDHVRIGDSAGRLWDSSDAGLTWSQTGTPAFEGSLAYRIVFDPHDIDHALVGTLAQGVRVSHDGGAVWTSATGLGAGNFNGFNLVVSPAQGDVVWVEGLDLGDPNEATSRHIYRSDDGGLGFTAVVDADDATLYNGNHLFAHPTDPDILYFVFGQNFGNYGTDLYRYDHAAATIDLTHNKWHDSIVEFLPGDPSVMYLGLSIEPLGG